MTPLQCAIHIGHLTIVRVLVEAGAKLSDLTFLWSNCDVPEAFVLDLESWSWLIEQATCAASLLHLCRLGLRRALRNGIHQKLPSLTLPKPVTDYILMTDILQ